MEEISIRDAISLIRSKRIRRLLVTGTKKNTDDTISREDEKLKQSIKDYFSNCGL